MMGTMDADIMVAGAGNDVVDGVREMTHLKVVKVMIHYLAVT